MNRQLRRRAGVMSRYLPEPHRAVRYLGQDPIYAAIERADEARRAAEAACAAVPDHVGDGPWSDEVDQAQERSESFTEAWGAAIGILFATQPTTLAGFRDLADYLIVDLGNSDSVEHMTVLASAAEHLLAAKAA